IPRYPAKKDLWPRSPEGVVERRRSQHADSLAYKLDHRYCALVQVFERHPPSLKVGSIRSPSLATSSALSPSFYHLSSARNVWLGLNVGLFVLCSCKRGGGLVGG
ncbi:hypothetical protein FA13DRAFT_1740018, partial [Coprinellus micaceus]